MDPLVVHNHLPKTGGKSLNAVVRANYGPAESVDLDRVIGDGARLLSSQDPVRAALTHWADYYRSLDVEQRARSRCVVGHHEPDRVPRRPVRLEERARLRASHARQRLRRRLLRR